MSDIREALAHAILVNAMCPGQEYIATRVADAILAEFLVVPRSDIVGTEYGISDQTNTDVQFVGRRAEAIEGARWRRRFPGTSEACAHERPVLPWSPIPLPEDGEK
jgi:hypothetical protein